MMLLAWVISWLIFFWIWQDASQRQGNSIGCLWALLVLALGPIAVLGYLLFGRN